MKKRFFRKVFLAATLFAACLPTLAQVSFNNDAVWEQEPYTNGSYPFTTALMTLDPDLDGTGNVMLIVVVFSYNSYTGFTCDWGSDTMDELVSLSGSQQGMWVFGLHEEDVRFTGGNAQTVTCTRTSGNASTGMWVTGMTFDGVNVTDPVNACAGTCTVPGSNANETLTIDSVNLSGDSGDMIVGFGDSFGATVPTCDQNGQSEDGPFLYENSHSCVMYKPWGGPQGDDIQFGNNDVSWGGVAGIVLNGIAATGPNIGLLRRGRGR